MSNPNDFPRPDARTLKFVRKDLKSIKRVLDEGDSVLARQILVNLLDWISYYTGEEIEANK